jgi:hypothetical protein
MLHAINMVPNPGVEMACNTPTFELERERRPLRALPGMHTSSSRIATTSAAADSLAPWSAICKALIF